MKHVYWNQAITPGYWAVWINGNWVDAASLTQQEAARKLKEFMKTMK